MILHISSQMRFSPAYECAPLKQPFYLGLTSLKGENKPWKRGGSLLFCLLLKATMLFHAPKASIKACIKACTQGVEVDPIPTWGGGRESSQQFFSSLGPSPIYEVRHMRSNRVSKNRNCKKSPKLPVIQKRN